MDAQNISLEQGLANQDSALSSATLNVSITPEQEAAPAQSVDDASAPKASFQKAYKNKDEIIERLKDIAGSETVPDKDEVDYLKSTFYRIHLSEREAEQRAFIEAGGAPEDYKALPSEQEMVLKAELSLIKEKRAKHLVELEAEKSENLKKKLAIIEEIKAIATSPDAANKSYAKFKELQQAWKDIKAVPADKANELWRNYHLYTEQFYDLLKLNHEAREYDFKKNLELKTKLCESAEKLSEEKDVVKAFHRLQELHQEYREIGPVTKELREEVWRRFKAASATINKRHQNHFEELRAKENENLTQKTALCEKIEALNNKPGTSASEWEKLTKEVIDIQATWKTIGFAPQKMNVKIFERFRAACDVFFNAKAQFFKEIKAVYAQNIEKKQELIAKAKELADSTDWKETTDKLIALQKEWKKVGMVPRKMGDKLWEEFITACNRFFEARKEAVGDPQSDERKNLEQKRGILEKLNGFIAEKATDAQDAVLALIKEYQQVGHVPYKEKDKLHEDFQKVVDTLKKELNISVARKRLDDFKNNIKKVAKQGEDALDNERSRLFRAYERIKQEVQTYENNLGFLSISSKKGNSLMDEMNRKIGKLKEEMQLLKDKIKEIDRQRKEETGE